MEPKKILIAEHISYFHVIVYRFLPGRYHHLAEDLAQDAMIRCLNKIHLYDDKKGNLKSWIYRVTQNFCFDMIRKMDKMITTPLSFDIVENEKYEFDKVEKSKIRKAIRCLPKRDRELIMMRFYFDCSGREISKALGIPEAQVATYFRRAKLKLRSQYLKVA